MQRSGSAVWRGAGKDGSGTVSTPSGALQEQPYSFKTRFVDEDGRAGTNPEELIAAAHAGCFSMATAFQLAGAGFTAEELRTEAQLTMESGAGGWSITAIKLVLRAKVPNIDDAKFQELAAAAKAGCPVSRVLKADITLDAQLEG
ncbi:MAG: OsmC family protein [Gemmatirosa sp.]|nr:OsmC family protein [Gemmatirosa sp.]